MNIEYYWHIRSSLLLLQSVIGTMAFSHVLIRRKPFWKRLFLSTAAGMVLLYVVRAAFFPNMVIQVNRLDRIFVVILSYLLLTGIILFCFQEDLFTALFAASAGYVAQDLGGTIKTVLRLLPQVEVFTRSTEGMIALDVVVYSFFFTFLYWIFRPFTRERGGNYDNRLKAVFSTSALLLCMGMMRITGGNPERNSLSVLAEGIYQVLCDVFILLVQFGVMERARLSQSVDTMRELVHEQHEQFRHSQQSVELVNEKYHDLKSLLEGFQGEIDPQQIRKLKERIGEYEVHLETGNRVLDIVLAEKRAVCLARNIEFTSYVNGAGMDGIEELDLYALVGNALNNAIDAVSALPEEERFISMVMYSRDGMITLHMENPYAGSVLVEDDLPVSRRDRQYHGFGVRSMERICEKYEGTLVFRTEDQIFTLDALLLQP